MKFSFSGYINYLIARDIGAPFHPRGRSSGAILPNGPAPPAPPLPELVRSAPPSRPVRAPIATVAVWTCPEGHGTWDPEDEEPKVCPTCQAWLVLDEGKR